MQVAEEVATSLPGAVAYPADLTEPEAADTLIEFALSAFGGLDIIVNNAGYVWHSAIHNMTDEQWDAMLDIHASAQFPSLACLWTLVARQRRPNLAGSQSGQHLFNYGYPRWCHSACLLGRQGGSSRYYQNPGEGMGSL